MIVSGEPVKAAEALRLGFVDAVLEGPLEQAAIAWARENAGRSFTLARKREDRIKGADLAAFDAAATAC
jgi:3-hydroxyacyl-CoA dehydrogenase